LTDRPSGVNQQELYDFIFTKIDAVPHLEALLLLWNARPRIWTDTEAAERLFVNTAGVRSIMADLSRHGLVTIEQNPPPSYSYRASPENDRLTGAIDHAYRTDLIRISRAIHSKGPASMREFARAFELGRGNKKP
jgi:predicted ArsR family transcriptional regulator